MLGLRLVIRDLYSVPHTPQTSTKTTTINFNPRDDARVVSIQHPLHSTLVFLILLFSLSEDSCGQQGFTHLSLVHGYDFHRNASSARVNQWLDFAYPRSLFNKVRVRVGLRRRRNQNAPVAVAVAVCWLLFITFSRLGISCQSCLWSAEQGKRFFAVIVRA